MSKIKNPDALIRIGDVIKVLCREKCYPGSSCPDSYCTEMWNKFEDVERVDAVPAVHGYWKEDTGGYGFWICSHCGFVSEASAADLLYRYCPHCGAWMDEKDGATIDMMT